MDIFILSLALSADAFGAALAVGMRRMGLWDKLKLSAAVGIMHVILPATSMTAGNFLHGRFGDILFSAGGLVLVITGLQMVLSFFRQEEQEKPAGIGIMLFAFGVSMDSFSTGLSLGVLGMDKSIAVMSFGVFSGVMTMAGLLLSSRISTAAGKVGEAAGGVFLLLVGLKWIFT
ncbi:manganese efflux pump [Domibacillus sp. DTU_2020_1001157_1_SI_ALB_TIR_016]|uniref:manganese efflux pump MntP n=1 Tax=Domibacillus sp. DTU_2020_1001157_1_SI_ALB_TIR_016 TaxID=3077789 RepID=UPI0028EB7D02|nr:manganese efflux pump [Domibacillus sp. DTU_2020_1001157_1_SI_ALB_TIR_016]WNS81110.1 manganese efflux pump [Domibacillus sp. DTU_2020_1001157_1_SI_ALB_TIR_016]